MFILIRLTEHVSGIIIPIIRSTDYVNNCMWSMPGCVGCSSAGWDTSNVHCVKVGILFIIIIGGILVLFIYITRLASNEIFSPSNKIKREVGRAKDLSAPLY